MQNPKISRNHEAAIMRALLVILRERLFKFPMAVYHGEMKKCAADLKHWLELYR